jgi:aryl-alcohol dehydrogenase-like predicted oxidoreductase
VKNFLAYSLVRLGVDHVDVYRPSHLDPAVPIEDTIGAIADLVKAGYVRCIGLSEVGPETVRRAHAVHLNSDLQLEYSLVSRGPEAMIFSVLAELRNGLTAYGALSRGLLTESKPQGLATSAPISRVSRARIATATLTRSREATTLLTQRARDRP